jgi:hypothetical protein
VVEPFNDAETSGERTDRTETVATVNGDFYFMATLGANESSEVVLAWQ